jgi:hypothetical protein
MVSTKKGLVKVHKFKHEKFKKVFSIKGCVSYSCFHSSTIQNITTETLTVHAISHLNAYTRNKSNAKKLNIDKVVSKLILTHIHVISLSIDLQPFVRLGGFFSFLIFSQLVGLLGRGISPSQGRYLHTDEHKHRTNAHRHPCLEWDSNPRSQRSSG